MKVKIKLLKHIQYGRERLYPNCPLSRAICHITGGKTLSESDVTALNAIGECDIDVEEVEKRPT